MSVFKKFFTYTDEEGNNEDIIEKSLNKEAENSDFIYNGVNILKPKSYDEDSKKIAEMIKNNVGGMMMSVFKKFFTYTDEEGNNEDIIEKSLNKEAENSDFIYNGVNILKPKSYDEDSKKIAEMIKNSNIVAFSLENMSREEGQRLIDYLSGASYVLGGTIVAITDKVFASIPAGVKVRNN